MYNWTLTRLPWKRNLLLLCRPFLITEYRTTVKSNYYNRFQQNWQFAFGPLVCMTTTFAISFREIVSIYYRNLIKTCRAVFKKIVILFWGTHLKGPCFIHMYCIWEKVNINMFYARALVCVYIYTHGFRNICDLASQDCELYFSVLLYGKI
jgi:hypothetical protein